MSDKEKKLNINLSDKSDNPVGSIHDIPIEDILAWKPGNPYAEGDSDNRLIIAPATIVQTCEASPSQWEAQTTDGRVVYVRYRWGCLSIGIGEHIEQAVENQMNEDDAFYYAEPAYELVPSDSVITFEQLLMLTNHIINWGIDD